MKAELKAVAITLFAAAALAAQTGAAQDKGEQITAQGFGPVAVTSGERLEVCVANMGGGVAGSTVQIFSVSKDAVRPISKHDSKLEPGKGTCYTHSPKTAANLFVILAGDRTASWDISDRNLVVSAQVLEGPSGKARLVLTPLPKVVHTTVMQQ